MPTAQFIQKIMSIVRHVLQKWQDRSARGRSRESPIMHHQRWVHYTAFSRSSGSSRNHFSQTDRQTDGRTRHGNSTPGGWESQVEHLNAAKLGTGMYGNAPRGSNLNTCPKSYARAEKKGQGSAVASRRTALRPPGTWVELSICVCVLVRGD